MIKIIGITFAVAVAWTFFQIGDLKADFKEKTAYYHCVRYSGAITDLEAIDADESCRLSTGYKGD